MRFWPLTESLQASTATAVSYPISAGQFSFVPYRIASKKFSRCGVWAGFANSIGRGHLPASTVTRTSTATFFVPVTAFGWTRDFRLVPIAVMLIVFLGFGVWAYNYPKFVDFLVETENELRTRVTWPTRKDLINASTVVVGAVVVIGIWVLISDWLFIFIFRKTDIIPIFPGLYRLFQG